jgi:chromosomal replication initiator protein
MQASPDRALLDELRAARRDLARIEAKVAALPIYAPAPTRIGNIVRMAAARFGVTPGDVSSDRRDGETIAARLAVYWVARRGTPFSTAQIGRSLGNRDHTTVLSGLRSADRRRARCRDFRDITDAMLAEVEAETARLELPAILDGETA